MPEIMIKFQILIVNNFNIRKEHIPIFSDDDLRRLTMPVFLFVGAKDIMLRSLETAERMKKLVSNARINILPEGGHSLIDLTDTIFEQIKWEGGT